MTDLAKKQEFMFKKVVYLSDTNAEGNVYFAKYFEWQGDAREEFVKQNIPNILELMISGLVLITCEAKMSYIKPTFLFENIIIKIETTEIKKASLGLIFTFKNERTGDLIGEGFQRIAFSDKSGKLLPMPEAFTDRAHVFEKQ